MSFRVLPFLLPSPPGRGVKKPRILALHCAELLYSEVMVQTKNTAYFLLQIISKLLSLAARTVTTLIWTVIFLYAHKNGKQYCNDQTFCTEGFLISIAVKYKSPPLTLIINLRLVLQFAIHCLCVVLIPPLANLSNKS